MLSDFGAMLSVVVDLMKLEFTLWGINFTFWQIMLCGMFIPIVIWILWEVFL